MDSSPQHQRLLHRVVYREFSLKTRAEAEAEDTLVAAVPATRSINLELVLAQRKDDASIERNTMAIDAPVEREAFLAETMPTTTELSAATEDTSTTEERDELITMEEPPHEQSPVDQPSLTLSPRLWDSMDAEVDLILPDRQVVFYQL